MGGLFQIRPDVAFGTLGCDGVWPMATENGKPGSKFHWSIAITGVWNTTRCLHRQVKRTPKLGTGSDPSPLFTHRFRLCSKWDDVFHRFRHRNPAGGRHGPGFLWCLDGGMVPKLGSCLPGRFGRRANCPVYCRSIDAPRIDAARHPRRVMQHAFRFPKYSAHPSSDFECQCALAQFWPRPASTVSLTSSLTTGSGAFSIMSRAVEIRSSTAVSSTSNSNSSCT